MDKIHGLTPLENVYFLAFFKTLIFLLKIILFFPQYQKRCFLIEILWKTPIRKTLIFGQNPWTNPFKKCPFFTLFKTSIFSLKIVISFINIEKRSFRTKFQWKTAIIKILIFGQNPWANPFQKYPLFGSCWNFNFLVLKWLCSIQNIQKWFFSHIIAVKNSDKKKFNFWTKPHGLTPIKNVFFFTLFKTSSFST